MSLPEHYAKMFSTKLASGEFPQEDVKCFCEADNYIPISDIDRYGIPYRICLCKECALLYANPRMTEEAFKKFYTEYYRLIYGRMGYDAVLCEKIGEGEIKHTPEYIRDFIYDIVDDLDMKRPKTVFDIGCGDGEILSAFGRDAVGVDYDKEMIENGRALGRNIIHGGIEKLEATGKKVDLIIMNHVLEHITNLKRDITRIRELLNDDGILYISVPGLYRWKREEIFQNAHTYQFNGNTLEYVMASCGFESVYLSEFIKSIWMKSNVADIKNQEEVRYIFDYLTNTTPLRLMPSIRVHCKFPLKDRKKNTEYVVSLGIPQITELINIHPDSDAIIISGGPSIDNYVEKIRQLQKEGAKIYSIERMYPWCLGHNIVPDYVITMDASDDVVEAFKKTHSDVTYILMSQCRPEVFDVLKDQKTYFFFVHQKGLDLGRICHDAGIKKMTCINSGGTVAIGALVVAATLGARNFHVFGFDCHINDGKYAKGIVGVGCINECIDVEIGKRIFKTTPAFHSFLQNFFTFYRVAKENKQLNDIRFYGDSMIKAASKINLSPDDEDV